MALSGPIALILLLALLLDCVRGAAVNSTNGTAGGYVEQYIPVLPTQLDTAELVKSQVNMYDDDAEIYIKPGPVPDIVLTLAVIAGCVIAGVGIAKLADTIYDRFVNAADKKQETVALTKQMLRMRAAVMNMKPADQNSSDAAARSIATKWMAKAAEGHMQSVADQQPPPIRIEDADSGSTNEAFSPDVPPPPYKTADPDEEEFKPSEPVELHPVEKIDPNRKPAGRLPPVVVHDGK